MGVRRNTFINLAGSVIPMAVMLITVPLYLKALGDVRYGVLALVWMLLGYFGFLEMGLGKATANQIARLRDASDKDRNIVFWTALLLNGAFGLVAVLILWIVGAYVLTSILKIPREFQGEAIAALPWMLATFPLALISSVLSGALEGRNRFFVVNLLQIASTVVFQIVPLFVVYGYGSSLAVVIPAAVVCRVSNEFTVSSCLLRCRTIDASTCFFNKDRAISVFVWRLGCSKRHGWPSTRNN